MSAIYPPLRRYRHPLRCRTAQRLTRQRREFAAPAATRHIKGPHNHHSLSVDIPAKLGLALNIVKFAITIAHNTVTFATVRQRRAGSGNSMTESALICPTRRLRFQSGFALQNLILHPFRQKAFSPSVGKHQTERLRHRYRLRIKRDASQTGGLSTGQRGSVSCSPV